jgi:hypothetical protein
MALLLVVHGGCAISPENRDPLFRIALKNLGCERGPGLKPGPKKEARPKGPGTPYALRRNIFRKRQKTMVCLAVG